MKRIPEVVLQTEVSALHVLNLDQFPPRIVAMITELILHQQVLTAYETGGVSLNWNGPQVRLMLEKVPLSNPYAPRKA